MKRRTTKTKVRRVYVKAKKSISRSFKRGYDGRTLKSVAMGSAIYGAFRDDVSNVAMQVAGQIPIIGNIVGTYGDEALLGIGGYFLAKKSKHKLLKNIGLSAMAIESARAGKAFRDGGLLFGVAPKQVTGNKIF